MRLVVPYVAGMLRDEVADVIMSAGMAWEVFELNPGDDTGYAELILRLWAERDTVIICEQDTVPPHGALTAMAGCASPWCAVPHSVGGAPSLDTIGCTKISAQIMVAHPDLAIHAATYCPHHDRLVPWRQLALRITGRLYHAGYTPCAHGTSTRHLNPSLKGRAE